MLLSLLLTASTATLAGNPASHFSAEPLVGMSAGIDHESPERRTYLRIGGGLATTEDSGGPSEDVEFDDGFLLALAVGRRMGAGTTGLGFGLEIEGLFTDQDADDGGTVEPVRDTTVYGAFLNGVLDFRIADSFTLYGTAGLGPAWLDIGTKSDGINDFDDEDGPFLAWQAKAGVAWHLGEASSFSLGYRFVNIDDVEIEDELSGDSFDLETQQHGIEVGFAFGL